MRLCFFLVLFLRLSSAQIQLGGEILDVEVVRTPSERARGLMGRNQLPEGRGMLFIYQKSERLSFWMKNTLIPLSIAFFDEEKAVINILDMDPPEGDLLIRYRSTAPALYALEVPQGWFEKHGINRGTKFSFLDQANQVK